MALPNFYTKVALSAAQVLRNATYDQISSRLLGTALGIAFDDEAVKTREGRIAVETVVNLASRLFPSICLVALEGRAVEYSTRLLEIARGINPEIEIEVGMQKAAFTIVLGRTPVENGAPRIYMGSDGWVVRLSADRPQGCKDSGNPFAAGACACFGLANAFRSIFAQELDGAELDGDVALSLIDFNGAAQEPLNPAWKVPSLGEVHLAGVGAIGSGVIWALRSITEAKGRLVLIDHEDIELSNLQRYIITRQDSIEQGKVQLAAAHWESDIEVVPCKLRWEDYVQTRHKDVVNRVLVALDSPEARCAVQAALPRRIINAWTGHSFLGISRHFSFGEEACLMCLYFPEGKTKNEDEIIAEELRMPERFREIRDLLYRNLPLNRPWLERIASSTGVSIGDLEQFENKSIRELRAKVVCGGITFKAGPSNQIIDVPLAFQSTLAGILLAGELVIDVQSLRTTPTRTITQLNILKPIPSELFEARPKHAACICCDPIYKEIYNDTHSSGFR
jgi:molybdopterin/thiamine biosynthesis adenylyltransferase